MIARTSWPARFGLLRVLFSEARLALRLLREPSVPLLVKMLPALAGLYLFAPLDVVPDVLPLLGQFDDLGVLLAVLSFFRGRCPEATVAFHRAAIVQGRPYTPMPPEGDVIDAEWRRG